MLEIRVDSDGGVETAGSACDAPVDAGHALPFLMLLSTFLFWSLVHANLGDEVH